MDSLADAVDYDAMDHREVNRRFVEDFLASCAASPAATRNARSAILPGELLDVGTGTAQIPLELCRRQPRWRVIAIDLSENMLAVGRGKIRMQGCQESIQLQRVDAKQMPYADDRFAAVMSNSIVHHIPDPLAMLKEALRVTRREGLLFVRDLQRPTDHAAIHHLVETYAGECNERQRQLYDQSLRAALALEEIRDIVVELGFAADTVQPTSDRHWTWVARKG